MVVSDEIVSYRERSVTTFQEETYNERNNGGDPWNGAQKSFSFDAQKAVILGHGRHATTDSGTVLVRKGRAETQRPQDTG